MFQELNVCSRSFIHLEGDRTCKDESKTSINACFSVRIEIRIDSIMKGHSGESIEQ